MLNNGTNIPKLGFGTFKLEGEICYKSVDDALIGGYRHVDTAEIYDNEKEIGKVIKNYDRKNLYNDLFITSKLWPFDEKIDRKKIIERCEKSIKNLNVDYLDLYLLHWPNKELDYEEVLKGFKQLYEDRKIKAFGVSNFTIHHLEDIIPIAKKLNLPISMNQVEFHPLLYQRELLNFCKKKSIAITAYSPLGQGETIKNKLIKDIAKRYNASPAQICLAWLLQKDIIAIPRSKRRENIYENFNAKNIYLFPEDMNLIDNIKEQKRIVNPPFAEFDY